jgi:hypothetical protein
MSSLWFVRGKERPAVATELDIRARIDRKTLFFHRGGPGKPVSPLLFTRRTKKPMPSLTTQQSLFGVSRATWLLVPCGVLAATLLGLSGALSRGDHLPEASAGIRAEVAEMRETARRLAELEDDREFLAGFYQLLARYHVAPIVRHGNQLPIAAQAAVELQPEAAIVLRESTSTRLDLGTRDFVRGVNPDGRWVAVRDATVATLEALVVRSRDQLIIIDLQRKTVSFADCGPDGQRDN